MQPDLLKESTLALLFLGSEITLEKKHLIDKSNYSIKHLIIFYLCVQ